MSDSRITAAVNDDWKIWLPKQSSSDGTISLKTFTQSIEKAARDAGKPNLGWQIGVNCNYLSRGLLGKAVLESRTLWLGLHWLGRCYPLIQDATHVSLSVNGKTASLNYKIIDPAVTAREQDALYTLGIFSNFIKEASKDIWPHAHINLEAEKNEFNADLHLTTRCPVFYGAPSNQIIFPAQFLECELDARGVGQKDLIELASTLATKNRAMNILDRARYVIYNGLYKNTISQFEVAESLAISPRTLRRKLENAGTSYQSLLDECRMEIAARELSVARRISFAQIALRLGYTEHSTFTRAFSRWYGITPFQFRYNITGDKRA